MLKPALVGVSSKDPWAVAKVLQDCVVAPLLRRLRGMRREGKLFQDWPGVGQFLDPRLYKGETALAKHGRKCATSLLTWSQHSRHVDAAGNVWMLFPSSRLKTDYRKSKGRKLKSFKTRDLHRLPDRGVVRASDPASVRDALAKLQLYDSEACKVICWRRFAKSFDDWRLFVMGPHVETCWLQHQVELPPHADRNVHMLSLCFFCGVGCSVGPLRAHLWSLAARKPNKFHENSSPQAQGPTC